MRPPQARRPWAESHHRPLAAVLVDLRECKLLSFTGIVPGPVRYADVVVDHADVRVDGARTFFIAGLEFVNERDVHPAYKTENAGLRLLFAYTDQLANEPFAVPAGQESPVTVLTEGPSAPRSFELSTVFVAD